MEVVLACDVGFTSWKCVYMHFHDSLTCIFLFSRHLEENPKIMGYMSAYTALSVVVIYLV